MGSRGGGCRFRGVVTMVSRRRGSGDSECKREGEGVQLEKEKGDDEVDTAVVRSFTGEW